MYKEKKIGPPQKKSPAVQDGARQGGCHTSTSKPQLQHGFKSVWGEEGEKGRLHHHTAWRTKLLPSLPPPAKRHAQQLVRRSVPLNGQVRDTSCRHLPVKLKAPMGSSTHCHHPHLAEAPGLSPVPQETPKQNATPATCERASA